MSGWSVAFLVSMVSAAHGAPTPATAKTAGPKMGATELREALHSGAADAHEVLLKRLATEVQDGGVGRATAWSPVLREYLSEGGDPRVLRSALSLLELIGGPDASRAIGLYLQHRVPEIRRTAARALIRTKGPDAIAALRSGLRMSDPVVRGYAATGLGQLGAKDAIDDLFAALDRGVPEAAASIGQLCTEAQCERFLGYLGKLAFDIVTSGVDPILFRASPLPEALQMQAVGVIRELGTTEARKYLEDVAGRYKESKKVKASIEAAIRSLPSAGRAVEVLQ